ncbi:hypothetical protein E2320_014640 [Naja naja]|nr:hypothetical protein E2320_014640 [Naja naja]
MYWFLSFILVDDDSGCGDRLTSEVTTASSSGSSDAKKARNTGAKGNSECLDRLTSEVTGSSDAMCIRNADDDSGCGDRLTSEVTTASSSGSSDAKKARNTGAKGNSECLDRLTSEVTGSSDAMCIRNAAEKSKSCPCSPPFASQGVACPVSWIGYSGKCFYVAKEERNWSLSLETCSLFNASLAVIDTQNELVRNN